MSRKANPTLIGAFVLGGVALLVAGVLIFGGREIFQRKQRFVSYFQGSVQGLRVGSDVQFRGVRIGYVTDITVNADPTSLNFEIPVVFEIIPDAVTRASLDGGREEAATGAMQLDQLIDAGLRAQLNMESWVTGQLVIGLDMHPGTPVVLRGNNPRYPEIPTLPSGIQQVLEKLQSLLVDIQGKVPLDRIVDDLLGAVNGFSQLVNSPDLKESLAGMNRLINSRETQDLPRELTKTLAELKAASAEARGAIGRTDQRLAPVLERAATSLDQLQQTLGEGKQVLSLARQQLASNPETSEQLARALREVERSAKSIRILVDYLERQPESVLRGKTGSEE